MIPLKQSFTQAFCGDFSFDNYPRQTPEHLFCLVEPCGFPRFELLHFNEKLAYEIGLEKDIHLKNPEFFAGHFPKQNTYATAYAGHQFGQWAGQLGDGRAIIAGEITNAKQQNFELQWKGAGATPYSRQGDGKAVLRSSVREYLISEAFHHLGIPTTRALSLCLSGEKIWRDPLYNGHPMEEKGAIVMRSAPSFLRFGHLEFLSAQNQISELKSLVDWVLKNYYPEIEGEHKYLLFFKTIAQRSLNMIIHWQRVGFVHGVMNTDNFSLLGLTIDYGPFSFLDEYNEDFTPNTSDTQSRYAFKQQASIANWNLTALANALMPLINDVGFFENELENWKNDYIQAYNNMMARKLGFKNSNSELITFIVSCRQLMSRLQIDYTSFFIFLEKLHSTEFSELKWSEITYKKWGEQELNTFSLFLEDYQKLKQSQDLVFNIDIMKSENPKFILRNFMLQNAIKDLDYGDHGLFLKLFEALQTPHQEKPDLMPYKAPDWAKNTFGAGRLSCSS